MISPFHRDWLNRNDVFAIMSNVRCLDGDQNIAECEAELVSLDCKGENIWLHCSNKTGEKVNNSHEIVTISLATT